VRFERGEIREWAIERLREAEKQVAAGADVLGRVRPMETQEERSAREEREREKLAARAAEADEHVNRLVVDDDVDGLSKFKAAGKLGWTAFIETQKAGAA